VIKVHAGPTIGGMTIITSVRTGNVGTVFTHRCGAIVTTRTGTCDIGMIEGCVGPTAGTVTILTSITAGNMGAVFTGGSSTIVTAGTTTRDITMVKPGL